MRIRPGRLRFAAACAAALLAPGAALAAPAPQPVPGAPQVQLLAPRPGTPLTAGTPTVLEWSPRDGRSRLPAGDEWEAFLSLDGGKSYPVRITPHLDRDLRRVVWTVPEAPSGDARILLRFGDERRELAIELPQRFTIANPRVTDGMELTPPPALAAAAAGESARPGDPAVVVWAEGSRRGATGRRQAALPAGLRDGARPDELDAGPTACATVAPASSSLAPPPRAEKAFSGSPRRATAPPRRPPPNPVDPLLQTGRRNE